MAEYIVVEIFKDRPAPVVSDPNVKVLFESDSLAKAIRVMNELFEVRNVGNQYEEVGFAVFQPRLCFFRDYVTTWETGE